MWQRWRIPLFLSVAAAAPVVFSIGWWFFAIEDDDEPIPPFTGAKLAVVLVFDQMRGDYLSRWHDLYGEGGFKRLEAEGTSFVNCHYPYAETFTAPGHASLMTGTTPRYHGIVANNWFDRATGKEVASVKNDRGNGPMRRLAPTVGDVLLGRSRGRSKIVSVSVKPRSAILLAALRAQFCYWLNALGMFETSDYYDGPHRWVRQLNAEKRADSFLGKDWIRLHPDLDYEKHSGPDDVIYEGNGYEQGRKFPHKTLALNPKMYKLVEVEKHDAVFNSPWGNRLLLDFAKTAIVEEKLGQREVPDLLCIGFSSNDFVGHTYGPDSQEVLDITLRSDLIVKELLDFLDEHVGKGKYVVALSADHGICPIPAILQDRKEDAGYVHPTLLTTKAARFLDERFTRDGKPQPWIETQRPMNHWIYLNQRVLRENHQRPADVEKALAKWLTEQKGVQAAYTRTQLAGDKELEDPFAEKARQSFHPDCSGDVVVVLKPHHLLLEEPIPRRAYTDPDKKAIDPYTTTHGSPHEYDTWVPLVVMGPGIQAGKMFEHQVAPQALAAMLSRSLGIDPPAAARYFPPDDAYIAPKEDVGKK